MDLRTYEDFDFVFYPDFSRIDRNSHSSITFQTRSYRVIGTLKPE
jgi:hypothetical protein